MAADHTQSMMVDPMHIIVLRLPGHIGPLLALLGTPALLSQRNVFLLEGPGRASGCTLVSAVPERNIHGFIKRGTGV